MRLHSFSRRESHSTFYILHNDGICLLSALPTLHLHNSLRQVTTRHLIIAHPKSPCNASVDMCKQTILFTVANNDHRLLCCLQWHNLNQPLSKCTVMHHIAVWKCITTVLLNCCTYRPAWVHPIHPTHFTKTYTLHKDPGLSTSAGLSTWRMSCWLGSLLETPE